MAATSTTAGGSSVAEQLIETYGLRDGARILDVGCGKGFLLHEFKQLLPAAEVVGFDVSNHGLADAPGGDPCRLFRYRAQDAYPWGDEHFDLVISLGALHNLRALRVADGAEGVRARRQEQSTSWSRATGTKPNTSTCSAGR